MSRCEGPIKPYHRSFGTIIDGMIADGFIPGVTYLCDVHFAERRREERAKVALPKDETTKFIGYEELPAQGDVQRTCADADRDRLGLPERPPERAGYWDDLFRDSRERQLRDLEAIGLNEKYSDAIRLKATASLETIAKDPTRSGWLRKMAAEAVERIKRSRPSHEASS